MTPIEMIDAGIRALRRTESQQISHQAGAAVAEAWAALAQATMTHQLFGETPEWGPPPPMDLAAAAKLDTDRPGIFWQTGTTGPEHRCEAWAGGTTYSVQCTEYEGHDGAHTFTERHP